MQRRHAFTIFDFVLNRMRPGITKSGNGVSDLFLPSAFTIFDFVLNRMRLGITKSGNGVSDLFLLSAFTIFAADN